MKMNLLAGKVIEYIYQQLPEIRNDVIFIEHLASNEECLRFIIQRSSRISQEDVYTKLNKLNIGIFVECIDVEEHEKLELLTISSEIAKKLTKNIECNLHFLRCAIEDSISKYLTNTKNYGYITRVIPMDLFREREDYLRYKYNYISIQVSNSVDLDVCKERQDTVMNFMKSLGFKLAETEDRFTNFALTFYHNNMTNVYGLLRLRGLI